MSGKISLYAALVVVLAGLLTGCSSGPDVCPTDGMARWGQEFYFTGDTPCFMDGHAVYLPPAAYDPSNRTVAVHEDVAVMHH
jgi:hypothetical protein